MTAKEQWEVVRRLFAALPFPRGCFCSDCLSDSYSVEKQKVARDLLSRVEGILGGRVDAPAAPREPDEGRGWSEEDHFLSALRWAARNR